MTTSTRALIAIFVLLSVGAFGLSSFMNTRSPSRMISSALAHLENTQSFFGATTIATFAPDAAVRAAGADPSAALPMVFVGQGGVNIPADKLPSMAASFTLVSGQEASKDMSMDVRALADGAAYVRLTNVPAIEEEGGAASKLGIAANTWGKMDGSDLVAMLRAVTGSATAEPQADDSPRDETATLAAWQRLRRAVLSPDAFDAATPEGMQKLGEKSARMFALPMKQSALPAIAKDAATVVAGRRLTADESLRIETLAARRTVTLHLWIDPKKQELLQLSVELRGVGEAPDENGILPTVHASMLVRFTGWNEPVPVEVPEVTPPPTPSS